MFNQQGNHFLINANIYQVKNSLRIDVKDESINLPIILQAMVYAIFKSGLLNDLEVTQI